MQACFWLDMLCGVLCGDNRFVCRRPCDCIHLIGAATALEIDILCCGSISRCLPVVCLFLASCGRYQGVCACIMPKTNMWLKTTAHKHVHAMPQGSMPAGPGFTRGTNLGVWQSGNGYRQVLVHMP
jgi:hypothetical protein